jgi:hypothetical protein
MESQLALPGSPHSDMEHVLLWACSVARNGFHVGFFYLFLVPLTRHNSLGGGGGGGGRLKKKKK